MSNNLIRQVARGPHAGKLAVIVGDWPTFGMLQVRMAAAVGDSAPSPYDTRIKITLLQPSYLKPL